MQGFDPAPTVCCLLQVAAAGLQGRCSRAFWHAWHCGVVAWRTSRYGISCLIQSSMAFVVGKPSTAVLCCFQFERILSVLKMHFGMHGTVEWLPGAPLGTVFCPLSSQALLFAFVPILFAQKSILACMALWLLGAPLGMLPSSS